MKTKKTTMTILIILSILIIIWIAWGYFSVAVIEKPAYSVIEKTENYEIREYKSYLIAEVKVSGNYREGLNDGFRLVADYIFGNNTKQEPVAMTSPVVSKNEEKIAMTSPVISKNEEKIAMTSPVVNKNENDDKQYVSFILPSKYTLNTLPTPNNAKVNIKEIPAQKIAVLKFSWWATSERIKAKEDQLIEALKKDNLNYQSIQSAFYNPPWTPPFMLRNEIWAILKK